VGKLRTEGYINALTVNDLNVMEELILKIEDTDACEEAIEKLIKENDIDAIFAVNELFAVTAIKILSKNGKKTPDDVAVIGFTDGIISKYSTPSITTVSQNGIKMGGKAAKMLIDRLESDNEDDEHYKTEVIETHLVIRESTPF
jgi:LacI family transcriptional regulator